MVEEENWLFTAVFDYVVLKSLEWSDNSRCHTNLLHRLRRRHQAHPHRMESAVVQGERDAICILRNLGRRLHRRDPVRRRPSSDLAVVVMARGQG
jgi:hypothetical protein